jgi:hypothetical protein
MQGATDMAHVVTLQLEGEYGCSIMAKFEKVFGCKSPWLQGQKCDCDAFVAGAWFHSMEYISSLEQEEFRVELNNVVVNTILFPVIWASTRTIPGWECLVYQA